MYDSTFFIIGLALHGMVITRPHMPKSGEPLQVYYFPFLFLINHSFKNFHYLFSDHHQTVPAAL
jgi:hypothetical protein